MKDPKVRTLLRIVAQLALVLLVLCAGGFAAYQLAGSRAKAKRGKRKAQAPVVTVTQAKPQSGPVRVQGMGAVIPAQSVTLKPEVSGTIVAQSDAVIPGGLLRKGDLIARIDPRDYTLAIEREKANLEKAVFDLQVEEGRQIIARQEWSLLKADVPEEKTSVDLALRKPHIRNARAAVSAARSRLKQAEIDLERTTIRAPFNAIVREEAMEVGQAVTSQSDLATLIGTDRFWVQVSIPVEQLAFVRFPGKAEKEGAPCRVSTQPGPTGGVERNGRVVRLLGDLDPVGRMARVLAAVEDPLGLQTGGQPLLVGAYVHVDIEGRPLRDVIRLPRAALREGGVVWVMNGGNRLEVRKVEIAWRQKDCVLVRSGLKADERIVTSRIPTPIPGMTLRLPAGKRRQSGGGA